MFRIEFVEVTVTCEPLWSPQKMTAAANEHLGIADSNER
ncbi:metal-sulfur cluster biosynthetic enzyme [Mesorhizobium shonense]|uniref:Metal-sulfur cluster biosynthetic enzyme n=1 Tax=Mesorhizobium shonense TaxID=1209948 RepID=A0ABV2I2E5_9HYPH